MMSPEIVAALVASALALPALWFALRWWRQKQVAYRQRDRLFQLSPDLLSVLDFDGNFIQVNSAWTRVMGWSPGELRAKPLAELVHPDDLEAGRAATRSLKDGEWLRQLELRFRCRDGSYRRLSLNACPLSDERLVMAVGRDVTDAHLRAQARDASEQRLRRLIDGLGPQIFVGLLTPDGTLVEVNRQVLAVAGLVPEDVIGKPVDSTFWFSHSPEARRRMRAAIERAASGEASRFDMEIQVAEGRRLTIDFSLHPLRDGSGEIAYLVPSASDVTDRTEAQQATRQALENFEKVFRGAPEPMSISELESGRFIQVNDAFCRLFGYDSRELLGRTSQELPLWSDWNRREELIARLAHGEVIHGMEGMGRTRGGAMRDLLISADRIEFDGRPALLLMFMDLTQRRRTELALAEANASLRQLSQRLLEVQERERAAVARELHDEIGQALTAIKLGIQWHARRAQGPAKDRLQDCIALADGALAQVRNLALELRPPQLDQLGLTAALRDLTQRIGQAAGLKTRFVSEDPDIAPGLSQATAAFRVAQEALTNAIRHAAASHVTVELGMRSGELVVSVSDDGRSFELESVRARAGKGGHLGLLGMQERVDLAGGVLTIDARPGEGTRVEARIPVMSAPAESP